MHRGTDRNRGRTEPKGRTVKDDNYAEDYAEGVAETIRTEVNAATDISPEDAAADYVRNALDAEYLVASDGWIRAVHLVIGTGGPYAEVRHYVGSFGCTVHVTLGQHQATRGVWSPALSAELDALAYGWADARVTEVAR